jgi:hypothetical protein
VENSSREQTIARLRFGLCCVLLGLSGLALNAELNAVGAGLVLAVIFVIFWSDTID